MKLHPTPVSCLMALIASAVFGATALGPIEASAAGENSQPHAQREQARLLFERGQEALTDDELRAAQEAFAEAYRNARQVDSSLAADALYWKAFTLYRQGTTESLTESAQALDQYLSTYALMSDYRQALSLATRVRGKLAQRGDAESAALIAAQVRELERRLAEREIVQKEMQRAQEEASKHQRSALRSYLEAQHELQARLHAEELSARKALSLADPHLSSLRLLEEQYAQQAEEDDIRLAALQALAEVDPDRALPILTRLLERRDEESARLRKRAMLILSMHGSEEATDLVLRAATEDPDPEVRSHAVRYLGSLSDDRVGDVLARVLFEEDQPREVKESAVVALLIREDDRSFDILQRVALDPDQPPEIRERAIHYLGEHRSDQNLRMLMALFDQVDDPPLQQAVVMAVGQNKDERARDWLVGILRNPDVPGRVRERAFFWVGMDDEVSTEQLIGIYRDIDDVGLRRAALMAIGEREEEASLKFIMQVAGSDEAPEIRRMAVFWLGQSDDPRAVKLLERIIQE